MSICSSTIFFRLASARHDGREKGAKGIRKGGDGETKGEKGRKGRRREGGKEGEKREGKGKGRGGPQRLMYGAPGG
jgi:hypothetical protein